MKKLLALMFMVCAFPFVTWGADADALNLTITMAKGQRSRDAGGATTSITISGETIVYELNYSGMSRRQSRAPKEFKLEGADRKRLIDLIKARKLLVTKSIVRPYYESGNLTFFVLSISSEVNGHKGLISIRGPRNAADIKESKLYTGAVALIEAIYEIIHRTDAEIVYEPLMRYPATTRVAPTIE